MWPLKWDLHYCTQVKVMAMVCPWKSPYSLLLHLTSLLLQKEGGKTWHNQSLKQSIKSKILKILNWCTSLGYSHVLPLPPDQTQIKLLEILCYIILQSLISVFVADVSILYIGVMFWWISVVGLLLETRLEFNIKMLKMFS